MADTQKILGACIRHLREEAHKTLETLSSEAGISYQYLSRLETGKENFSIQVLTGLCTALNTPLRSLVALAFDRAENARPPIVNPAFLRANVPLPTSLTGADVVRVLDDTQRVIHRLNRNLVVEGSRPLQGLIQGNNFSGLVSNILTNSFDALTSYRHNSAQRYPDLLYHPPRRNLSAVGLEVKTTVNVGKGGESHNGHGGWHVIACFRFTDEGDIVFVHVMFADLCSHQHPTASDWKYTGSKVNEATGSRRTETYSTNLQGTTKLRDGSIYLDPAWIDFSRWRKEHPSGIPAHSIWATA
jgi:transcriptional regulator with XRE-family HTH domain